MGIPRYWTEGAEMSSDEYYAALLRLLADPTSDVDAIAAATVHALQPTIYQVVPRPAWPAAKRGAVIIDLRQVIAEDSDRGRIDMGFVTLAQIEDLYSRNMAAEGAAMLEAVRAYAPLFETVVVVLVRDTWAIVRLTDAPPTA